MKSCQYRLFVARKDLIRAHRFSDWMTLGGGAVATGGATTSAVLSATQGKNDSKAGAIVTAAVGGVGGIVALASKLTDGPDKALEHFLQAQKHWVAGNNVVNQTPKELLQPGKVLFGYAFARFNSCVSNPSAEVPPYPETTNSGGVQPATPDGGESAREGEGAPGEVYAPIQPGEAVSGGDD
jgi:hypothetical protein